MAGEQALGTSDQTFSPAVPSTQSATGGSKGTGTAVPSSTAPAINTGSTKYSDMFANTPSTSMPVNPATNGKGGSAAATTFVPPSIPLSPLATPAITTPAITNSDNSISLHNGGSGGGI